MTSINTTATASQRAQASMLSGILDSPSMGVVDGGENVRRYAAVLTSVMEIGDNPMDVSDRTISFEVGGRHYDRNGIVPVREGVMRPDCSVRVGPSVASDFAGAVRKYANFAGDFTCFDLCDVVARLTEAIAIFAQTGGLTTRQLSGNQAPRVVVLGATGQPVTAGTGSVFLSRAIDSQFSPNAFVALVYAVAGSGSRLVTDYCEVDQNGQAVIGAAVDGELAHGCYHALRIIGSNYDRAGEGALFAYAVTRGAHAGVSVVSHTDEGGYIRKVLRSSAFAPSFGGIDSFCRHYTGLPRKDNFDQAGAILFIDTIALVTAAAVSACDPLVSVDGRLYPYISSAKTIPRGEAGVGQDIADADRAVVARFHGRAICDVAPLFAKTYISALATIYSVAGTSTTAERHLVGAFAVAAERNDRHLHYPVVAPFFWIEPTGVCKLSRESYPAIAAGYGQLTELGVKHVMPCFERMYQATPQACDMSTIVVGYRGARTCGLVQHLVGHVQDGLANLVLEGLDPSQLCITGGDARAITDKMAAGTDMAGYLWVRGQSPLSAPAECIYTGQGVRIRVSHVTFSARDFSVVRNHVPSLEQLSSGMVTFCVTQLRGIAAGERRAVPRDVRRARSAATDALSNARARVGTELRAVPRGVTYGDIDVSQTTLPVMPGLVVAEKPHTERIDGTGRLNQQVALDPAQPGQSEATVALPGRVPAVTLMTPSSGMRAARARVQAQEVAVPAPAPPAEEQ